MQFLIDWLTANSGWIGATGTLASLVGLVVSWLAWQGAKGAKQAADEAKQAVQRRERGTTIREHLADIIRDIDLHRMSSLRRRPELSLFSARLKDRIIRCSKAAKSDYEDLSTKLLMVGTRLEPSNLTPPESAGDRLEYENTLLMSVGADLHDIAGDLSYGSS